MPIYQVKEFSGGLSDYENRGIRGAFKFGTNLDIRKKADSLSAGQAYVDEGLHSSRSPSASVSPSSSSSPSSSASATASPSASVSPSSSASHSPSPSTGISDSPSRSPSASASPSASVSISSSVSPSPSPSAGLATVFEDLIRFFVKATDGYVYGFGSTGVIYRRNSDAYWARVYKDPDGAIKGAIEKPSDSGKTYLEWCTDTKLKRKELPGNLSWNDVSTVSTNLSSQDWHTMVQINGAGIIANGENLALVGYDDSFTNEALNLIPGNIAKTLVERSGRAVVGTYRASDPNKGINGAIDAEVPLAQVGNSGELYYANMLDSTPVKTFPGGGKVNPGGVCNSVDQVNFFEWEDTALSWIDKQTVGNMALFAVYGADSGKGGIYSYGRKNKNHPMTMNLDYQFDATELGAITSVDGTILVSYRSGSDFGVKASDSTTKATATYEGLEFSSPIKTVDEITSWNIAEIYCEPLPAGCSIQFWYKLDKSTSFTQATMADDSTSFSSTGETKAVFQIGAKGDIFEPKVVLVPSANLTPEVHRIVTYFN